MIGGVWRSRLLNVLDLPRLRPTTDRVRETLFNWLGQDLTGLHCLDICAGTGVLGFEAASRHASTVTLLEKDKKIAANLLKNLALLQSSPVKGGVHILQADGLEYLKRQADHSFNLIFIDPPFAEGDLFNQVIVEAGRICDDSAGGGIYIEFPASRASEEVEALLPGWECRKYLEAGQVKACLFRSKTA
ncbi:16S rRNA (guanine(966)-N(2))-methyltransferase RsmD [Polynucleobacter antarcticus]|uniref:16S rRNA (guanine(966)-N(2))-methyltransferase RsmD n=1 Tax=Polynucleobacter antarcticus TaxID=1743162 RepID=UPI0039F06FBF